MTKQLTEIYCLSGDEILVYLWKPEFKKNNFDMKMKYVKI